VSKKEDDMYKNHPQSKFMSVCLCEPNQKSIIVERRLNLHLFPQKCQQASKLFSLPLLVAAIIIIYGGRLSSLFSASSSQISLGRVPDAVGSEVPDPNCFSLALV
jgi:hypothetical protein